MKKIVFALALLIAASASAELVEKVVARINDRLITWTEYQHRLEQASAAPGASTDTAKLRKDVLDELIREKLLEEKAAELDVQATDEEVSIAVERVKRQYNLATDEDFARALASSNLTPDQLKDQLRQTITLQKVVSREVTSRIDMSDDSLRLEYERRKEQLFQVPESARVAEIVIRFDPQDPSAREQAAARIEEARGKMKAGTPFADIAKEYSQGAARERGGDLGRVNKGELLGALDAAVFGEPRSDDPPPILLPSSVHLLHVSDRLPAGYRPFSEVKDELKRQISEGLYQGKLDEYLNKLRQEAFVKIYEPDLAAAFAPAPAS
ncbi:MAG TPA: SurA N-terminal domain-containing protein [Thermoanaerobaculia bacterium]|jgi:parvulin-like peptidyl-prolyl isomerase